MNGERCRDANLQFEPSMRRADEALAIAIIECTTIDCAIENFGRTKPKWSMFSKAASEASNSSPGTIEIVFGREGRLGTRTIRITAMGENRTHDTVSTVSRVSDHGDRVGLNHPPPGLEQAL